MRTFPTGRDGTTHKDSSSACNEVLTIIIILAYKAENICRFTFRKAPVTFKSRGVFSIKLVHQEDIGNLTCPYTLKYRDLTAVFQVEGLLVTRVCGLLGLAGRALQGHLYAS